MTMTIAEFARHLSEVLPKPFAWQDDSMVLEFDDGVVVKLEYDPDAALAYLYSPLAEIPEQKCAHFAPALLKANLFATGTGGSDIIAYDRDSQTLLLWEKFALDEKRASAFPQALDKFQKAAASWRDHLRAGVSERGEPPRPSRSRRSSKQRALV